MNFLWDLTTSSHAGRVTLFENVNGFPLPYLRERMYRVYDRSGSVERIRQFLNIEDVKPPQMG
jgi:4-hydroxyphenylacetate 3-monooxygenase